MQELHGVLHSPMALRSLKRALVFFDQIHLVTTFDFPTFYSPERDRLYNDLQFLQSKGVLTRVDPPIFKRAMERPHTDHSKRDSLVAAQLALRVITGGSLIPPSGEHQDDVDQMNKLSRNQLLSYQNAAFADSISRRISAELNACSPIQTVPICHMQIPSSRSPDDQTVMRVALESMPLPDESNSLQDILDFKAELHDKQWTYRRFLRTLISKQQTEAEVRDEIEWMVNEYRKAMAIQHLKTARGLVDVFIVSPLEVIENLLTLNLSKVVGGMLSVEKHKIELLEAEMKAPGRECAYVFDARKRFD